MRYNIVHTMRLHETIGRKLHRAIERPDRVRIAYLNRLVNLTGLPAETQIKLTSGRKMWIKLPDVVSVNLAYEGKYEPEVALMMEHVLHPGSVFFDVGAHYGLNTLHAYDLLQGDGKIVSFEPTPQTRRLLQRNCQDLTDTVTIDDRVVSQYSGQTLELSVFDPRYGGCNSLENPRIPLEIIAKIQKKKISVTSVSLDDYCAMTGIFPDVIKLDVENHEMAVLQGAVELLRVHSPNIIMEIGDLGRGPHNSTEACLAFLRTFNYRFWQVDDGVLVPYTGDAEKANILAE